MILSRPVRAVFQKQKRSLRLFSQFRHPLGSFRTECSTRGTVRRGRAQQSRHGERPIGQLKDMLLDFLCSFTIRHVVGTSPLLKIRSARFRSALDTEKDGPPSTPCLSPLPSPHFPPRRSQNQSTGTRSNGVSPWLGLVSFGRRALSLTRV